jgi:GMP synthase-like glutamine amidotransferase
MLVYVDLEHNRLRQDPALWQFFATKVLETKYRLEAISGDLCLIVHYDRLSPALLHELKAWAVVVGGHYTGLWHYAEADLAGLKAVLQAAAWPTLGFCGGFQLMAQTYGADLGPIADISQSHPETPLPPGILGPGIGTSKAGRNQEQGFTPIQVSRAHPLFEGLGHEPVVFELHSWEVKAAPDRFRILAQSDLCRVQAIAHQEAPLFGTQFHPELYDDDHPDGRRILENFFQIARGFITTPI